VDLCYLSLTILVSFKSLCQKMARSTHPWASIVTSARAAIPRVVETMLLLSVFISGLTLEALKPTMTSGSSPRRVPWGSKVTTISARLLGPMKGLPMMQLVLDVMLLGVVSLVGVEHVRVVGI